MPTSESDANFYWQTARDSLLTPAALNLFSIAIQHDGEEFDSAKLEIDQEYQQVTGRSTIQRHGGNFQTFIRVFEESGWMVVEEQGGQKILRVTNAGRQAATLIGKVPDFLKAIPFFLVELLARYQLNNPSGPSESRNQLLENAIAQSDIFPYWTLWKIMRSCNNKISTDELRRFVFRLQQADNIEQTIAQIKEYRRDIENSLSPVQINEKYPQPLAGAVGEPKYIMARAGTHIGKKPSLITKPNNTTYELNPDYFELIDNVLSNERVFKDYIDSETWFKDYSQPVVIDPEIVTGIPDESTIQLPSYKQIDDQDPIWQQVISLIEMGALNILFVGPPGTSKTTYAMAIGAKLVENDAHRFHNIQFHQSFGYEDFMEGYVPSENPKMGTFSLQNKVFLRACDIARQDDPSKKHVLIIDELNRGEPSRIFGEGLTYIERRGEAFRLPSGRPAIVPKNLIILATMNPYDKTIADLDMAMDRRFEKISFAPSADLLREIVVDTNGMEPALAGQLIGFFNFLSAEVENRIGHAYFKDAKDVGTLRRVWMHKILPVLDRELRYDRDKLQRIQQEFNRIFPATS